MISVEIFLSLLTHLLYDRYTAFLSACLSWAAPWLWHFLDTIQAYWSDDFSDSDSDVSSWKPPSAISASSLVDYLAPLTDEDAERSDDDRAGGDGFERFLGRRAGHVAASSPSSVA